MRNRNVHSLCLVLYQDFSSTHALPSSRSVEERTSPAGLENLALNPNSFSSQPALSSGNIPSLSQAQSLPVVEGSNNPVSGCQVSSVAREAAELRGAPSKTLFPLRSKSAIFKAGVITPITPNFSPAARGHHDHQQRSSVASTTEVHGRKEPLDRMHIQAVNSNRYTATDCNTPISLDQSPSWKCTDVSQATMKLERYVSLSNLPTPPPSHSPYSPVLFPEDSGEDLEEPELLGPAYYLAPLIPISASATPPSIPLLQRILYRFNLRTEVIALAGIILDTLSPQFVRKWRTELAQLSLWEDGGNKCEVLALVALGIAAKWIEDTGVSLTATTLSDISGGRFCPREINVTERLLLQDIAYDLKGLSCEEDLAWAVKEIQRCTAARVEKEIDL